MQINPNPSNPLPPVRERVDMPPVTIQEPPQEKETDRITLQTQDTKAIPSLPLLPAVTVEQDGRFTFRHNAHGRNITEYKQDQGTVYNTSSDESLSLILKNNQGKRDTLVFSNMSDAIQKNSQIPNVYFHIPGNGDSQIHFDEQHNIVVDMGNGEQLILDGKDGQTVLSGPFEIDFDPKAGTLNVTYTGANHLTRYRSRGDHVQW